MEVFFGSEGMRETKWRIRVYGVSGIWEVLL